MPRIRTLLAATTLAMLAMAANPARADLIDSDWCAQAGLRLTIEGPTIVTPGGARMSGEYDRHGLPYDAPSGDPGVGARVTMWLVGENLIRVQA